MFFRKDGLDFTSMDEFMAQILDAIHEHGSRAVRIFPPPAQVLVSFADRLANDVVRHTFCCTMYFERGFRLESTSLPCWNEPEKSRQSYFSRLLLLVSGYHGRWWMPSCTLPGRERILRQL